MDWKIVAVFAVSVVASGLSGMAGGGASFIITPLYIWLGLTPQQAVATGKFGGLGVTIGALAAFRDRMLENKKLSLIVMSLTTIVALTATLILKNIENTKLQILIGAVMLAMAPVALLNKRRVHKFSPSSVHKTAGLSLLALVLLAQGVLSSGIGSLTTLIFMVFFGMSPLEANIMKRKTSVILTTVMPVALLASGLINFKYGFSGMAGGLVGGYVGSHIAIKKGDDFARGALIAFMILSGLWLIFSA